MAANNYDKLYLNILKIAQNQLLDGLSYNELREQLILEGYDFKNDCIELAVKRWFYDSFHHMSADTIPYNNFADLDNHLDCSFVLNGDSCLKYLDYQNSKRSNNIAIIALFVGVVGILLTLYLENSQIKQQSKKEESPRSQIQGFQQGRNYNDSLTKPSISSVPKELAKDTSD